MSGAVQDPIWGNSGESVNERVHQGNYVYTLNIVIASATVEFGVGITDHFRKHSSLVNL